MSKLKGTMITLLVIFIINSIIGFGLIIKYTPTWLSVVIGAILPFLLIFAVALIIKLLEMKDDE